MLNAPNIDVLASPFVRPQPIGEPAATVPSKSDQKKLNEAASIVTAVKHCLAMDGSLNRPPRLVDAYNNQPDLENLPKNMNYIEKEKTQAYVIGRPDIPDFGFLIADIWRVTPRDMRIKFNSIISLKLMEALGFKSGAYAFEGNCKPVMQGDITESGIFEYARVNMPLAFNDKDVKLTYIMVKQNEYNWQIEDLLINDVGVTNYVKKDLVSAVNLQGIDAATRKMCKGLKSKDLKC